MHGEGEAALEPFLVNSDKNNKVEIRLCWGSFGDVRVGVWHCSPGEGLVGKDLSDNPKAQEQKGSLEFFSFLSFPAGSSRGRASLPSHTGYEH